MSRESIEQLIASKAALNAEQFETDEKLAALPPEHLWAVNKDPSEYPLELTPAEVEVKDRFLALNGKKLSVKAQLDRAQSFGLRFAKTPFPSICLPCFVNLNVTSPMKEIKSTFGNGFRRFLCTKCDSEISIAPTP